MSVPAFKYEPLQRPNEIRILHLSTAPNGTPCFRLSHEILDQTLPFEAVSYTWGSATRENVILHADTGHGLRVTANGEMALRSLAATGNSRLWMDSLCINQEDMKERSHQVRLMGPIFRIAKRTIAYIGEPDEHSRAVLDMPDPPSMHGMMPTGLVDPYVLQHVPSLLERAWFSRTWVIQEALLSNSLAVRIGTQEISFAKLSALEQSCTSRRNRQHRRGILALKAGFSQRPRGLFSRQRDTDDNARDFALDATSEDRNFDVSNSLIWSKPLSQVNLITSNRLLNSGYLFDVLCTTSSYGCLDPRDKVHALSSLFEHSLPDDLQADYSRGVDELYANISRFLLCYGVTRVLVAAARKSSNSRLPSWAVDWRCEPYSGASLNAETGGRKTWFFETTATAGFASFREMNVKPHGSHGVKIRGLRVTKMLRKFTAEEWKSPLEELRRLSISPNDVNSLESPISIRVTGPEEMIRDRSKIDGYTLLCGSSPLEEYVEFVSSDEKRGLVPAGSQEGDWVCIFLGISVPFVVRPYSDGWQLLGECYLEDHMHGEAVRWVKEHHVHDTEVLAPLEDFILY